MDLIIDGNAFINVAISVTKAVTSKDKRIGDTYFVNDLFNDGVMLKEGVKHSFRGFCFTYLNSLIAPIGPSLDRVHCVFDSKSWRKEYIASFFKHSDFKTSSAPTEFTYKGNRRYDEYQYLFFDYFHYTIMPALVKNCGINHYRFKDTEGDDIIAKLCETLSTDILIYSVDQDLKQLVSFREKNIMLIVPKQMSKTKKLYTTIELHPDLAEEEEEDFFSLSESHISGSSTDRVIKSLKEKDYAQYPIDPSYEVLEKILLGDKSDNIPKLAGITPAKAKKVIDVLLATYAETTLSKIDMLDESFIELMIHTISAINKIREQDKLDELRTHLIFHIRIMRLSTDVFPDEIRNPLKSHFESYQMTKFTIKDFIALKNNQSTL